MLTLTLTLTINLKVTKNIFLEMETMDGELKQRLPKTTATQVNSIFQ